MEMATQTENTQVQAQMPKNILNEWVLIKNKFNKLRYSAKKTGELYKAYEEILSNPEYKQVIEQGISMVFPEFNTLSDKEKLSFMKYALSFDSPLTFASHINAMKNGKCYSIEFEFSKRVPEGFVRINVGKEYLGPGPGMGEAPRSDAFTVCSVMNAEIVQKPENLYKGAMLTEKRSLAKEIMLSKNFTV